ncbi:hypothetical protein FBU30_004410 [Linnemannia zychae]|nr:hypothetical protein FBU30_004410 [Linnemannia zychae]
MFARNFPLIRSTRILNATNPSRHVVVTAAKTAVAATTARLFHASTLNMAINHSLDGNLLSDDNASLSNAELLFNYSAKHSTPLPEKFDRLHAFSMQVYPTNAGKTVSSLQGHFQQMMMRLTNPKSVLELGTFMGYSGMAMADGMAKGSTLYTCENDPQAAQLSRELFESLAYCHSKKNPDAKRKDATVEVIEGDGLSSLAQLSKRNIRFDAVFLADNVLFSGMVLNSKERKKKADAAAAAGDGNASSSSEDKKIQLDGVWTVDAFQQLADHIDTFNEHVKNDPRVDVVLLPAFDGLSLIMKRRQ